MEILNDMKTTIKTLLMLILLNLTLISFSQIQDSEKNPIHLNGSVTITNNGISFIPTFTLGKPAAIFDLSIGRRLSFDPQFRFALEGKPWSFIFWGRYKLVNSQKFIFSVGAHPAFTFKTISIPDDAGTKEIIRSQRYAAAELSPNYYLAKNISIGLYYLYGHCFENDAPRHTHFLTINTNFSRINLYKEYYIRVNPQFYYLKIGGNDGYYFSSSMTLARKNFPVSISFLINKAIQTRIVSKDFVWNASLIYSFNNQYVKK
jgi:hypothetical protein